MRSHDAAHVRRRVASPASGAEYSALPPLELHDLRGLLRCRLHTARDRCRPNALRRRSGRRALLAPRACRALLSGHCVGALRCGQSGRSERLRNQRAERKELLPQHRGKRSLCYPCSLSYVSRNSFVLMAPQSYLSASECALNSRIIR